MEFLQNIPFLIRIFLSLLVIIAVNKKTGSLSLSLFSGVLTLALMTGHSAQSSFHISAEKMISANNIFLLIAVCQVIWLSSQMSNAGMMRDLVNYLRGGLSKRNAMAVIPAVIGLLPMPGGAVFSAPLVDDCDTENNTDPVLKSAVNYWFRHIWEYWWPLYPGILLAVDITRLSITEVMLIQLPLCAASIIIGYFFLLRRIKAGSAENNPSRRIRLNEIAMPLMPIIIIISCYALIKIFLPAGVKLNTYIPIIAGIFAAQLYIQARRPAGIDAWKKIIFSANTFKLALIVALVGIYGAFIESALPDGTLLMSHVRLELNSLGIPVFFIIILIPFISGITTGISIGFVGASFPIIISLAGQDPEHSQLLSSAILAFASGFMGVILSPLHVCLIVTCEYFHVKVNGCLRRLIAPASCVIAFAVIIYFIIS